MNGLPEASLATPMVDASGERARKRSEPLVKSRLDAMVGRNNDRGTRCEASTSSCAAATGTATRWHARVRAVSTCLCRGPGLRTVYRA